MKKLGNSFLQVSTWAKLREIEFGIECRKQGLGFNVVSEYFAEKLTNSGF